MCLRNIFICVQYEMLVVCNPLSKCHRPTPFLFLFTRRWYYNNKWYYDIKTTTWYANDITTTTPFLFFFTTRWYYNNNIHSLAIDITIDVMICKWYYINHTLFSSCSQGDDITITTPFLLNISLTIDIMILKQPHDMQKILHQPHPFSSCSQQDDITMTTSFLLLLILLLLLLQ